MDNIVVVRFIKADRSPICCYAPGDIAGFERRTAEALIKQGFAVLHDAGKGPGKVNPDEIKHLPEPFEVAEAAARSSVNAKARVA